MKKPETKKPTLRQMVDWPVAMPAILLMLAIIIWALLDGEHVAAQMAAITDTIAFTFGGLYQVFGLLVLGVSLYVCFSKCGSVKMGQPNDKPEFSNFAYFAILFSSGYGVGLTLWGLAEPLYISQASVFGLEPGSPEMAEMGLSYAFLHWGWIPWAFYGLLAVIYGYYIYNKKLTPRFLVPLESKLGTERYQNSKLIKILEGLILFMMLGGLLPMMGFGVKLVATGMNIRFGTPMTTLTIALICITICGLFTWAAVSGLKKGFALLGKMNIWVAFGVAVFVFLVISPTFVTDLSVGAFGGLLHNFFKMTTFTDPIAKSGFPQTWTIIYWIWWLANAFMTGLIIATVARGRTIRQAILPILVVSPVASWFWFAAFSGGAFFKQFNGMADYVGLLGELGKEGVVFQFLSDLPLGQILTIIYIVLIMVFDATTLDSACITFSQICLKRDYFNHDETVEPPVALRTIWSLLIGVTAFLLLLANIEFAGIQSVGAVMSLPGIAVYLVMIWIFLRDLHKDLRLKPHKDA